MGIRSPRLKRINNILGLDKTLRLIRDCDLIVGQKLHTSVFAAAAGTPFVSVAYRPKCIEFVESMRCTDCIVRTDEKLPERLIKVFENVWRNRKSVTKRITRERDKYRKKILAFAKETAKLIESYSRKK